MNLERRKWNVVATVAGVGTVLYIVAALITLMLGTLPFAGFKEAVLPLVMAWSGYLARMLGEKEPQ